MADRDPDPIAKIAPGIASVEAAAWDALAGGNPLVGHAFLALLERSGSVGPGTGWQPTPILVEQGDRLTAAVSAYLKSHSQGEYVFDHGWADAFTRAGGRYYPKLLAAVPFTPCPGPRLLGQRRPLLAAMEAVVDQNGLSGAHLNFIGDGDVAAAQGRGWLIRHGVQFHWRNDGFATFDDFLADCSSRKRKTIRRERRDANAGVEIETLRGVEIGAEAIDTMWACYQDTGSRKWGQPYLTRAFFDGLVDAIGEAALIFLARRDGVPVAAALNIVGPDTLYGRYWGALDDLPFLHFELSYYRAIEWAIDHGLSSVQAGAQGEHKVARGYRPVLTRSAHYLPDPGFRDAVARYLDGERAGVAQELAYYETLLPYRSSP